MTPNSTPAANWAEIALLLDEAVERLGERDRQAILLRYFNGLSHQQVGATLGLSENTANKRIERALEKLRGHFASRLKGFVGFAGHRDHGELRAGRAGRAGGKGRDNFFSRGGRHSGGWCITCPAFFILHEHQD